MAGNLLIPECLDFSLQALPLHGISASIRSKCLKAEGCTLPWTGSSLIHVLILPCTRTKDESAVMAGDPLVPECLDFAPWALSRHGPSASIHSVKSPESQGLYFASDWVIFGSGVDLPCTRAKDVTAEIAGDPLIPECLDFQAR